jgi:uncharacterized protein YerC
MPHVSRNKLSKQAEEALIKNLNLVLVQIQKNEEMLGFIEALLTETEKLMLAKRLAMIVLLEEGLPDTQIADILHVTRITVAKMRYFYEARGQGFKVALDKLKKQEQFNQFKKLLVSLAGYSIRAAGGRVKPGIIDL